MKRNERLALLTSQRALQAAVATRDHGAVRRWLAEGGDAKALWAPYIPGRMARLGQRLRPFNCRIQVEGSFS